MLHCCCIAACCIVMSLGQFHCAASSHMLAWSCADERLFKPECLCVGRFGERVFKGVEGHTLELQPPFWYHCCSSSLFVVSHSKQSNQPPSPPTVTIPTSLLPLDPPIFVIFILSVQLNTNRMKVFLQTFGDTGQPRIAPATAGPMGWKVFLDGYEISILGLGLRRLWDKICYSLGVILGILGALDHVFPPPFCCPVLAAPKMAD